MSLLSLTAASIGYEPGCSVLRDVHFSAEAGEAIALLGGNGAGKTALLRYIAGLVPRAGGECKVRGRRIDSPRAAVAAGLGLMVQDPDDQLLGTTLAEDTAIGPNNLGCSPAECKSRVQQALAEVGMSSLARREIVSLSLGERKRAALAGVLAMQPQLLLLDEPTAGLDPQAERAVCDVLRAQQQSGKTLIVATHAVDLVPYFATRVLVLAEGRVLADGPCREILVQGDLLVRARVRQPWPVEVFQRALASHAGTPPLTMEELLPHLRAPRSVG